MDTVHNYKILVNERYNFEVSIIFPIDRTIGELKQFILDRLRTRNMEGTIYYLFNPHQIELNEEGILGGLLFPDSIRISESILENNSLFCVDLHREENNLDDSTSNNITNTISNNITPPNSFVSLVDFYNSYLGNFMNYQNLNENEYNTMSLFESFLSRMNNIRSRSFSNPMEFYYITTIGGGSSAFGSHLEQFMNEWSQNGTQLIPIGFNLEDVKVGLLKDDLEALKLGKYSSFLNDKKEKERCENCSVCLEKFTESDLVRELKCEHLFHKDCIDHWLEDNIKCPLCRKETGRGVPKL